MRIPGYTSKHSIAACLFSLLMLCAGFADAATTATTETGFQEVVLKVENMT